MTGDQRLRVLYLDTETVWRGGQEQLLSLAEGMARLGHRVVLGSPADAPLAERAGAAGIDTIPYTQRTPLSPRAFRTLRAALDRERFQIVHSNTPRSIVAAALAAAASRPCPVRVAARRVVFPLRNRLSVLQYNRLLDCVITVCDSIGERLIAAGVRPALVRTVHEGVDPARLDAVAPTEELPPGRRPLLGALGALTPEKGQRVLLEAWARAAPAFPEGLLVLIGDGPCRPALERRCRELGLEGQVLFAGFQPQGAAWLRRLDLFCLPSLSEGFSSALLEAMACGLAVVATRVGGTPEAVIEGETGRLVSPGDSEPMAAAIQALLEDGDGRRRMGEAGRARVRRLFTVERKVAGTERIYRELLGSGGIG